MREEFTTGEILRIWWCFLWRFAVGSFAISFVLGFVIGLVGAATHFAPTDQIKVYAQMTGFGVSVIWSLLAVVMILHKRYRGFRIVAVRGDLPLCRME
jgi:hypothetical protein